MLTVMDETELQQKWDRRYTDAAGDAPEPLAVLIDNAHLLPERGIALDLACGLGGSAEFLARHGLHTLAWDISPVAIAALSRRAEGLDLEAVTRDVHAEPPECDRFDVINVGHFLERSLCRPIAAALKPGGLLFYQTFTRERVDENGPGTARFRLATNELLRLFPDLIVRVYREEGRVGETTRGVRNLAQLVAQRPD